MSTEKLSELSKPVGFVSKQAQALLKSGDTASVRPFFDVQGSSPLYSQEYVSALLAELETKDKRIAELEAIATDYAGKFQKAQDANKHLIIMSNDDKRRITELEAKLATPVRLPRPGFVTFSGERHYTYGADEVKGAIRAAGFTVEGDE